MVKPLIIPFGGIERGCTNRKVMRMNALSPNVDIDQRSNVESTFSMMKRKQGTALRTKSYVAQVNELLCKAVVHNICVLIQEIFVSGVTVDFQALAEDELMCKSLA